MAVESLTAPARRSEYLSVRELAATIPYAEGTIRNLMTSGVFIFGVHYVKPRGRIMFRRAAIEEWLKRGC